ncbi:hypothetical protein CVO77_02035 [Sphingopyxis lindanitolerans]|uniref:Lipoprotein n=1 Tax=Sphingopyxis lindanitolerans TaxID=2054227 RepID=A0A2S8B4X5_9SPHN|nr:hypothetical protein [Sphingopyxis lindanitolerans]PQM27403.1 hypothetical protein CVO77_02035 [Sphingopyxis lindanitolerans]
MKKRNRICATLLSPLMLLLAACNGTSDEQAAPSEPPGTGATLPKTEAPASSAPAATATAGADIAPAGPRSCAAEIGQQAADRRAAICRTVSPATHPPCNAANSCAMIENEIARSCALLGKSGALPSACRPDPDSKAAAIDVVKLYYSALDAGDYDTAWLQWGEAGPPKQTPEQFRAGFAHTRSTRVTIGTPGDAEGAAGSIYLTLPVAVDATLDSGTAQRFGGEYVLRRVNNVDGASADQLRWHITSAKLRPLPAR